MRSIAILGLGAILVAACSSAGPATPASTIAPSVVASPAASAGLPVEPTTPASITQPPAAPSPSASVSIPTDATEGERQLLAGARLDLQGSCVPLRTDLAERAVAAVACRPSNDYVERVTLFLFDNQADLLDTYFARLAAHGVKPHTTDSGRCAPGQGSEGAYVPGDDRMELAERGGCYVDAAGAAHYLATQPPFVLIELDGKPGNLLAAVERWAWLGNQDQPGAPTAWREIPVSPEK